MDSFFGIGPLELVLILIIAGIVMGPERIVHAARWLGQTAAQLQAVSQGLRAQLQKEVDGLDDDGQLRDTMEELRSLQREVSALRQEVKNTAVSTFNEAQQEVQETQETENSIQPPSPSKPTPPASKLNGHSHGNSKPVSHDIPRVLEIPDDPE